MVMELIRTMDRGGAELCCPPVAERLKNGQSKSKDEEKG